MLATLALPRAAVDRWLHEIKFDGYRLQGRIEAGRVSCSTRSGLEWTEEIGKAVVVALQDLGVGTAIIDGGAVVDAPIPALSIFRLTGRSQKVAAIALSSHVFDLLISDGCDLRALSTVRAQCCSRGSSRETAA